MIGHPLGPYRSTSCHATESRLLALVGVFVVGGAALRADEMTLTGTVGDAMCGVKQSNT